GIRDFHVTGVQTCALPISVPETDGPRWVAQLEAHVAAYPVEVIKRERAAKLIPGEPHTVALESGATLRAKSIILATGARWRSMRSEERRVGKGCRSRGERA